MIEYIALLRGINVGGNNTIRMSTLKAFFETMGFSNVRTYIQSGNVLFASDEKDLNKLTKSIEDGLSKTFDYKANLVLITKPHLEKIVVNAPKGFGSEPTLFRYDVIFLKPPLTVDEAVKHMPVKEGVDMLAKGENVVYFSRLISKATQSRLNKIIGSPIYKYLTIRNWNTTKKLTTL
mgnify:FL=1